MILGLRKTFLYQTEKLQTIKKFDLFKNLKKKRFVQIQITDMG